MCYLLFVYNCHAETTTSAKALDQAKNALFNKDYPKSIAILKHQLSQNPGDSEARYLIAKAYAWKGDVPAALEQLDLLIQAFPDNTDYLLSKARFLSWQNKNTSAIKILERARKITPHYKAIWELEITLRIRVEQGKIIPPTRALIVLFQSRFSDFQFSQYLNIHAANKQSLNTIISAYQFDRLNNNTPDWREFILDYIHRKPIYSYQLGVHTVNRFNINDHEISLGFSLPDFHKAQFNSRLTFSTEQILLARWSLYAQILRQLYPGRILEADLKHSAYSTIDTDVLRIAYGHQWKKLETKLYGILNLVNDRHFVNPPGYILSASYFFDDRRFIRIMNSQNTELVLSPTGAIRYAITTYSVDGKLPLNKNLALGLALTHTIQGKAYSRNEIYAGIQYQY